MSTTVFGSAWVALAVSLIAAVGTLWVMIGWMRRCSVAVNPWVAGVLLFTTYSFARAGWLGIFFGDTAPLSMIATLFCMLALRNFFYVYKERFGEQVLVASRAMTPVWLFGALVFGGLAGVAAPAAAMAVFLIVERRWRHVGQWFGVREVLIFCFLCVLGFVVFVAGARSGGALSTISSILGVAVFAPAPDEHLFWYPTRLLLGLLPWAPLYIFIIVRGLIRGKIKSGASRFFLHAMWSMLLALSLISSKSTLYLLPVYPFIVCLTAALLAKKR